MSNKAKFERVPMVRFERTLPGPIERVWDFLVNPDLLSEWFGEGTIEARVGGSVRLMNGHIRGVVTVWAPHRHLSYTWNVFSPGEAKSAYPESYVRFELEPRGDQVLLVLTHLPVLERFEEQNAMGWHTFLDMVEVAVQGREIEAREIYMQRNAAQYGVDLANLAR
jgi:uncharacterized protein YndB with AHSA1/START domain